MKYPNFKEEKKLWKKGHKIVIGLDEAGRGPLAGSVVAAAVCFKKGFNRNSVSGETEFRMIKDSKKLTSKKREEFYKMMKNHHQIEWGIGRVSEKVIDRINILEATKLAMEKAVRNLGKKLEKRSVQKSDDRRIFARGGFLIIDGNFGINLPVPQKSIIKADEKVFSCTAAGIIAKVTRDRIMLRHHKKYPQYRFDRHKGYPTKLHRKMLKKHGPSIIHRLTFNSVNPVRKKSF